MGFKKVIAIRTFIIFLLLFPSYAIADFWTIRHTSDELQPLVCPEDHLVTGVFCSGRYCDNIWLSCSGEVSNSVLNSFSREWRPYISEENPNRMYCYMNDFRSYYDTNESYLGIMTGISCKNKYCDNISIECSFVNHYEADWNSCYWSNWISEENGGSLVFPDGYYANGIECSGRYCDNKRFHICKYNYIY